MSHVGNVFLINDSDVKKFAGLKRVEGHVSVNTPFKARALKEVTGSLQVCSPCQLPSLVSVGGDLQIWTRLQAPQLTNVGGKLEVFDDFHAPVLTMVGGEIEVGGINVIKNNFYAPVLKNRNVPEFQILKTRSQFNATNKSRKNLMQSLLDIRFMEASNDDESIELGIVFSVTRYQLYKLYLKALAIIPESDLPLLPQAQHTDALDFLSLSDFDIQYWLREIQSEWLISALRYLNNPDIEDRVFSNMSPRAGEMYKEDVHSDIKLEIEGPLAKTKLWETLDRLQNDGCIFNWRGDLTRVDESDKYSLDLGCGSIMLNADELTALMRSHYPALIKFAEQGV